MASAGRKLSWAALGVFICMVAAACAGGDASSSSCASLDSLGLQIDEYEELLVWPGITAAPLREATDELGAAVLVVAGVSDDEYTTDITEAFALVAEAVSSTIPDSLVESRPEEPAQMAARFISVELQSFIDAHTRATDEQC